jgi:hypothetical protein
MANIRTFVASAAMVMVPCICAAAGTYSWEPTSPVSTHGNGYEIFSGAGTSSITYRFFVPTVAKSGANFGQQEDYPDDVSGPKALPFKLVGTSTDWFNVTVSAHYEGWFSLNKGFGSNATVEAWGSVTPTWLHGPERTFISGIAGQMVTDHANMAMEHKYVILGSATKISDIGSTFFIGDSMEIAPGLSASVNASGAFDSSARADMGGIDTSQGLFVTIAANPVPEPQTFALMLVGLGLGLAMRHKSSTNSSQS